MLSHPTPSVSVSFSPLLSTRQPYSCAHQHQWWSQQTMPGPVYYLPLPLRSASCGLLGSEPPSNLQTTTASSPRTESWENIRDYHGFRLFWLWHETWNVNTTRGHCGAFHRIYHKSLNLWKYNIIRFQCWSACRIYNGPDFNFLELSPRVINSKQEKEHT